MTTVGGIFGGSARRLVVAGLLLAIMPGGAALAKSELAPVVRRMIEGAAARDAGNPEPRFLTATAILAVDADAETTGAVIAALRDIAPDRASRVIALLRASHPEPPPVMTSLAPAESATPRADAPRRLLKRFGLVGDMQVGGALTSGNTNERALNTAVELVYDDHVWKHRLGFNFDFTRTRGATTKQRFVVDYQLDYKFSDRAFTFGYLQYEDERFSGFDFRTSQSAGIGYKLIEAQRLSLNLEGGPALRQDKPELSGSIETEFGGRLKESFEWRLLGNSSFTQEASFFVGSSRSTFETTLAFKTKINASLSGRVSYDLQWDSNVPADRTSVDTITRFAVVYDF